MRGVRVYDDITGLSQTSLNFKTNTGQFGILNSTDRLYKQVFQGLFV
jgi:hypothetical protein